MDLIPSPRVPNQKTIEEHDKPKIIGPNTPPAMHPQNKDQIRLDSALSGSYLGLVLGGVCVSVGSIGFLNLRVQVPKYEVPIPPTIMLTPKWVIYTSICIYTYVS